MLPRIAIAGNPNSGKTCIFNQLTGAVQQVSNYPGVTVERKEGTAVFRGRRVKVIDLPGTYSLTAYSLEEVVARNVIIGERPDLVVDVADASNLERNLYLAVQIMEMQVPMVLALNMVDIAAKRGIEIDTDRLSRLLGIPVVPTVGHRGKGVDKLLDTCIQVLDEKVLAIPRPVTYGHEVDRLVTALSDEVAIVAALADTYAPRWVAVKLIEEDAEVLGAVRDLSGEKSESIKAAAEHAVHHIQTHFNDEAPVLIAERRYGFAAGAVKECLRLSGEARQNMTDRIDSVVCNRFIGPIILVAVVTALFFWVFKVSDEWHWIPWIGSWVSPTGLMEWAFEGLSGLVAGIADKYPMLHSLLDDALIGGVGGVMSFVPLIFVMFLFVSALEDTGYVARVAFLLDRVLRTFGLQGKSILPMIVSGGLGAGGCAVPGVLATRTLREDKDRLVTMLVVPFMNCGAKMPVYAMLIAAFFPRGRTQMMLLLWAISWVVALCAAWTLRRFVIKGEQTPFVMELPAYHVPTLRGVLLHTWERTWMYAKKAGTIILAINIVLWAFMYFPRLPEQGLRDTAATQDSASHGIAAQALAHSFAGRFGLAIEPVSRYAGFDWRTNIALIGGFAAKEVVVGTLGTAYSIGNAEQASASLSQRLAADPAWSPLKAFALMIFVMIYAPCFVCMTMIRRESGSWKWAFFSTAYSTTCAFILAVIIYQIGGLLGLGV